MQDAEEAVEKIYGDLKCAKYESGGFKSQGTHYRLFALRPKVTAPAVRTTLMLKNGLIAQSMYKPTRKKHGLSPMENGQEAEKGIDRILAFGL